MDKLVPWILVVVWISSSSIVISGSKDTHNRNVCHPGEPNPCCRGWSQRPHSKDCLQPVCTKACGEGGQCVAPDICRCPDGLLKATCVEEESKPTEDPRLSYYRRRSRQYRPKPERETATQRQDVETPTTQRQDVKTPATQQDVERTTHEMETPTHDREPLTHVETPTNERHTPVQQKHVETRNNHKAEITKTDGQNMEEILAFIQIETVPMSRLTPGRPIAADTNQVEETTAQPKPNKDNKHKSNQGSPSHSTSTVATPTTQEPTDRQRVMEPQEPQKSVTDTVSNQPGSPNPRRRHKGPSKRRRQRQRPHNPEQQQGGQGESSLFATWQQQRRSNKKDGQEKPKSVQIRQIPILQQDEGLQLHASLQYTDDVDADTKAASPINAPRLDRNHNPAARGNSNRGTTDLHGNSGPYHVDARLEYDNDRRSPDLYPGNFNPGSPPVAGSSRQYNPDDGEVDRRGYKIDASLVYDPVTGSREPRPVNGNSNSKLQSPDPNRSSPYYDPNVSSPILSSIHPANPCDGGSPVGDCDYNVGYPYYYNYYNPCDYECPEGTDCPPCEFDANVGASYNYPCPGPDCGSAPFNGPPPGRGGVVQCPPGEDCSGLLTPCFGEEGCDLQPLPPCLDEDIGCREAQPILPCNKDGDEGCGSPPDGFLPPCFETGDCLEPCSGPDCPPVEGPDYPYPPCNGPDCPFEPCVTPDCTDTYPPCSGPNCPDAYPPCAGTNCPDTYPPCSGPTCPDYFPRESFPPCQGPECPYEPCTGPDCPPGSFEPCSGPDCASLPVESGAPEPPCLWPECDLENPHHHVSSIEHMTPGCLDEGGCGDGNGGGGLAMGACPEGELLVEQDGFKVCQSIWDVVSECEQKAHPDNPLLTTKDCEEKLRLLKAARSGGLNSLTYIQQDAGYAPVVTCFPGCENGGSCLPGNQCLCQSGYTGDTCQHDVDECMLSPCEHDCMNTMGSYQCLCPTGWELADDHQTCKEFACTPACKNGGLCDGGKKCICPPGFTGKTCHRDVNECRQNPCHHHCHNQPGSYRCSCNHGYKLHTDNHACIKLSQVCYPGCQNGGSCRDNQCDCKPGFEGRNCQLDVNECSSHPCHHRCINLLGSYYCTCYPGFELMSDRNTCRLLQF